MVIIIYLKCKNDECVCVRVIMHTFLLLPSPPLLLLLHHLHFFVVFLPLQSFISPKNADVDFHMSFRSAWFHQHTHLKCVAFELEIVRAHSHAKDNKNVVVFFDNLVIVAAVDCERECVSVCEHGFRVFFFIRHHHRHRQPSSSSSIAQPAGVCCRSLSVSQSSL